MIEQYFEKAIIGTHFPKISINGWWYFSKCQVETTCLNAMMYLYSIEIDYKVWAVCLSHGAEQAGVWRTGSHMPRILRGTRHTTDTKGSCQSVEQLRAGDRVSGAALQAQPGGRRPLQEVLLRLIQLHGSPATGTYVSCQLIWLRISQFNINIFSCKQFKRIKFRNIIEF